MKTALTLISLISLASFFTLNLIKTNESLRFENPPYCSDFGLNPAANFVEITNNCNTNVRIQFTVNEAFLDKTQYYSFETQCLKLRESQVFQLEMKYSSGSFSLNIDSQTEC